MLFEENKTVWWSRLLWAIALGDIALGVWMWFSGIPGMWVAVSLLAITFFALVAAAIMFSRYFVTFDGKRLSFGFTKLNGYVPIEAIESATIIRHVNLLKFGGVGWRFDFGGKKIGFLANKGQAIEIKPKAGNWHYVFNCNDAEGLTALLAEHDVTIASEDSER